MRFAREWKTLRADRISPSCPGKSAKRVFALDVPGIHVLAAKKVVDGRVEPGHDGIWC
jgi:hypothetical protein